MKRYNYLLSLVLLMITASCSKKEVTLPEPGTFSKVRFRDPFMLFQTEAGLNLAINYQGKPLASSGNSWEFTVLPGEGKFEFLYKDSGIKALETTLNIDKDSIPTYVFFKPDANSEQVQLIEDTQGSEAPPAPDHIKVKLANFAQSFFGNKNIKVVFSQNGAAVDTIQTQGTEYTSGYSVMPRAFTTVRGQKRITYQYELTFLDENDLPIADPDGNPLVAYFISGSGPASNAKSIFTIFLREESETISPAILFES
ncbi:hypothetical protein [Arcticibacter tournemirensis]|uniref:DUF4397 domain-containing protein n=1 Tax=Arcticibacter tournemirensis TaxID=699437 RepID=A0A4Q0MA20_9SPHI|nr:hypothetical protein [Arcticibacter tournemirensis]RXF70071.1 hypothetical protein EKH83_09290 [Arcticibacter tournemirensis]